MNEISRYSEWWMKKNEEWEAKCQRCGACCGSLDDPCENLRKDSNNKYFCAVYVNRFGQWKTISGKEIVCVPIREKLAKGHSWPGDEHCGYKK